MDISTILKFAGILVSGALGILGTVTETRDKKTGRLTTWGKTALWLTIAGLGVAFGAQLFDSLNQKRDAEESRKRSEALSNKLEEQGKQSSKIVTNLNQQAEVANQSLDNIKRIATRFEAV